MTFRLGQPARFVLVGTGGFLLNVCAFSTLYGLGAWYPTASVVAYLLSNGAMYLGNRYLTFALAEVGLIAGYLRYLSVGLLIASLTALLLSLLVERFALDPRLGQALALAALVPLSFSLSKRWAFRLGPDAA